MNFRVAHRALLLAVCFATAGAAALADPAPTFPVYDPDHVEAIRDNIGDGWEFQIGLGGNEVHAVARAYVAAWQEVPEPGTLSSDAARGVLDSALVRIVCRLDRNMTSELHVELYFWENGHAFLPQRFSRDLLRYGRTFPSYEDQHFGPVLFTRDGQIYTAPVIDDRDTGDAARAQYHEALHSVLSILTGDGLLRISFQWNGARTLGLDFLFLDEGKSAALAELARYCPILPTDASP